MQGSEALAVKWDGGPGESPRIHKKLFFFLKNKLRGSKAEQNNRNCTIDLFHVPERAICLLCDFGPPLNLSEPYSASVKWDNNKALGTVSQRGLL